MTAGQDRTAAGLVDLERYPIDDLDGPRGRELLARCHADLKHKALCRLPDFVLPEAVERMAAEAAALAPLGHYRNEHHRFAYHGEDLSGFAADHPARMQCLNRYRQLLNHHIANDSPMRRLYLWQPMTEFVRRVFGARTMFRSQCPHLSLTVKIEGEGDTDGWHYDPNDGVVSLLLQKPDAGGLFEYAPYVRSDDDERYDDVARLFADPLRFAERPAMEPGTFVFFNGRLSMHRVTPVGRTRQPRIIALFSYDRRPDQVFSQRYIDHLRGFPADIDAARPRVA